MQLNNIVNSHQMEELPLIGRGFNQLELIEPGVSLPDTRFTTAFSVNGSQAQQSEYLINGADTNDIALNTIALTPNLDGIDQFNLVTGPLNAEYDRNSGGIVSATIKQGTNHIHGNLFEFYRDTFLNTNNYFQKTFVNGVRTDTISPFHQNIFGGTVGGPILKDKIFAFFAYQGTHQRTPEETTQNTVYTAANLGGNFSGDLAAGSATPFSTNPIPSSILIPGCATGQTWASCLSSTGGVLPTSTFNPIASAIVKQYVPGPTSGTTGFNYNATDNLTQNQYLGRVDYSFNPKNQFTVVGIYQSQASLETLPFSGSSLPGFGDGTISHIQQYTFDYVRQVSSSAVNDLAAHYTRFNDDAAQPQQIMQPSASAFAITPQDAPNATLPQLAVTGFFTLGGTNNGPQPRIDQVIQFDDNFSKSLGHHNLKLGYDGRRFNVSNTFDNSNSGSYGFASTGTYSTGDASLDLLLGIPSSYSQGTGAAIQADAFLNYIYAQDNWKLANNFTLDYGLGYSIDTPLRNHQFGGEAVACFSLGTNSTIFPGAPTNLAYPGDPGCKNSGQASTRYTELGPRFGFAWAPDLGRISGSPGKFSIRGGFGIYYDRTEEESALQTLATPPFGFTTGGAADFGGSPSLANPFVDINGGATAGAKAEPNRFPYTEPVKGQVINFANLEPIFNISSFDKSFRSPYSENFQLSVEREFPSKMVARFTYVGALGRHNQVTYEGDYVTAAGHAACLASATCIADRNVQAADFPGHTIGNNPNFISIGEVGSYASSNYNSGQISLTKAETHGLQFQLSYTYAHSMDNASSFENSGFGQNGARGYNQFVPGLNYGDSTFDIRHHFVFAPVYSTPIVKGKSFYSPVSLALSGWQVSGILTLATGEPFDISYAGGTSRSLYCSDEIGFYACPDVPLQIAPLVRTNPKTRLANGSGQLFSAASFAAEPIGSFGNIHRDPYHGPGTNNTNLILAKNILLSQDSVRRLQLRLESDNVFNHTQLLNPTSNFTSGVFGQISAAAATRLTQLGAKFYF